MIWSSEKSLISLQITLFEIYVDFHHVSYLLLFFSISWYAYILLLYMNSIDTCLDCFQFYL